MQDDWHTPLGTVVPASRPTSSRSGSRGGAGATQPPGAAAHTPQLGGLLAAKESEAALLRQQLQQLTGDFKFNLKVCMLCAVLRAGSRVCSHSSSCVDAGWCGAGAP